jgi:hypothetical protein
MRGNGKKKTLGDFNIYSSPFKMPSRREEKKRCSGHGTPIKSFFDEATTRALER